VGNSRLGPLDGWRAISVALVIAFHMKCCSSLQTSTPLLVDFGLLGVQFFFGISGFVICRGLLAERERQGKISLLAFYLRRCFRILPPLMTYVAAVMVLVSMHVLPRAGYGVIRALTFTCNDAVSCGGYIGGHTWSLSVEEQFYVVFPLALVVFGRSRRLLTGFGLAVPALVAALFLTRHGVAYALLPFVTISAGVLSALHERRVIEFTQKAPAFSVPVALVALLAVEALPHGRFSDTANCLLASPLILFVLMTTTFRPGLLSGALNLAPLRAFGTVSYGIYLWQQIATYPWPGANGLFYALSIPACLAWHSSPSMDLNARSSGWAPGCPTRYLRRDRLLSNLTLLERQFPEANQLAALATAISLGPWACRSPLALWKAGSGSIQASHRGHAQRPWMLPPTARRSSVRSPRRSCTAGGAATYRPGPSGRARPPLLRRGRAIFRSVLDDRPPSVGPASRHSGPSRQSYPKRTSAMTAGGGKRSLAQER
jgi:peptidoglycan/LPS O-acetylase OafA/YrhL